MFDPSMEVDALMPKPPAAIRGRQSLSPRKRPSAPKFEIIYQRKTAVGSLLLFVGRLGSFVAAARDALGDAYALAAGSVLERAEALEDSLAERQQRRRRAALVSPAAQAPATPRKARRRAPLASSS